MAKMGRPRGSLYGRNKSRDPNRRKIMEKAPSLSHLTAEERLEYKAKQRKEYYKKLKSEDERLGYLQEGIERLKTDEEKNEFRAYINKKNKKRLEEILSDSELMWQIFADREDITTVEVKMIREKNKENKDYVTDKEVDEAMNRIYGGYAPQIIEEEDREWKNPYGELP